MKKGKLIVVSGPSAGVGKDTILKMFFDKHPQWNMPPSTTTRAPRPGELDGKDMHFIDRATFENWQTDGKFLESILVNDNQWYGTLREPVETLLNSGSNIILRKDVRGALLIKEAIPEAVLIFITAESPEALESRIRARGTEDEEGIIKRLELAKKELTYQDRYDHIIINPTGHPETALQELEDIVSE